MKTAAFLLCVIAASAPALSAERLPLRQRVSEFAAKYRTADAIDERVKEWSASEPENPDPYILGANAYLSIAADGVVIDTDTSKSGLAVVDPKTNKQVGTIRGEAVHEIQMKGEALLAVAAMKFPHRLDIHVGRMSVCESAKNPAALERAALQMFETVAQQGDRMRWIDDKPIDGKLEAKMVDEIQGRIGWLYAFEKSETDEAALRITVAAQKLYPGNPILQNNKALYFAYKEDWAKAREAFIKASELAPSDLLIKHNIAMASLRLGERDDARKRWEAIIKEAPESDEARQAKEQIRKLSATRDKKPKAK